MRWMRQAALRFRSLFGARRLEREMGEEFRFHLERQIEQKVVRGMPPEEARYAALREFGGVAQVEEECRDSRGLRPLENFVRDLRYGLRLLARNPGFALMGTLILALGIGGTTAVFSLLYTAVLRPLPYPEPEQLYNLPMMVTFPGQSPQTASWSYPKFEDMRRLTTSFEAVAGFSFWGVSVTEGETPERIFGELVTENYFSLLRVEPVLGRLFLPEEERVPNAHSVALLSEGLWRRRFGGRADVMGSTIHLDRFPFTVVGVLPEWFRGETGRAEIWASVMMAPTLQNNPTRLEQRGAHWMAAIGRARAGVGRERADADIKVAVARMEEAAARTQGKERTGGGGSKWDAVAIPLLEAKTDPAVRSSLLILLGAIGFVLLMACLNLANMLLGRAVARRQEMAVRLAIGANRGALLRQLLTESVVLACLGGLAGVFLASRGLDLLRLLQPRELGTGDTAVLRALEVGDAGLSSAVMAFAVLLALSTVMLFGLWPALRACRCQPYEAIKSNRPKGAGSSFRFGLGGRAALVVMQVGLAFVLLTGAGLMLRSFAALLDVPVGFDPGGLITFRIDLPRQQYDTAAARAFHQRLTDRLTALPGVENVAVTSTVPLRGNNEVTLGRIDDVVETGETAVHMVAPQFFETFRIPLREGRLLSVDDREGTRHVVLINESAARRFFPTGSALGSRIALGLNGWWTEEPAEIVGVVGDVQYQQVESPIGVNVYISSLQRGHSTTYFALRTGGSPEALIADVRSAVRELDAALPVYDIATGGRVVADATSKTRFSSALLGVFAVLALLLATAGVYAVVSYSAAARTPEIGVRLALGAEPGSVVRLMMRDVTLLCLAGLGVGALAALAATRLLVGSLYAVQPNDLATFAWCAALLLCLSLLACYLPARRASRIDPLAALRYE